MPRTPAGHRTTRTTTLAITVAAALIACSAPGETSDPTAEEATPTGTATETDTGTAEPTDGGADEPTEPAEPSELPEPVEVARFADPWAMTFLPDGQALITEKGGRLLLVDVASGQSSEVAGIPDVVDAGQGGLGDVIPGPDFETDRTVYLSWVEAGDGGTGAAVGWGQLAEDGSAISEFEMIWRQQPKTSGNGHFSHRLAFSPDGAHLFVTSGDRQELDPAQDLANTLGTIVRLNPDGSPADDNPFADRGGVSVEIWSYGHRNPLGIAFDADGNLWSTEMGPQHGDELNVVVEGANYGWPLASQGDHYSGEGIPDHAEDDGFEAPREFWVPAISPGSLMIYSGEMFPDWQGDAFVGALSGQALVRVAIDGTQAEEAERWDLGERIREVEQGPDGAIYLLEDGDDARLLRFAR